MSGHIFEMRGFRRLALAFSAGAASVLALAPFHLWPVLFITLPVLVLLIDGIVSQHSAPLSRKPLLKSAAGLGWAFGFGYFLFGLYWIGKAFLVEAGIYILLMPVAMTLMPAGLALFYALAIALAAIFWRPGASRIIVLALVFALGEWLRGHILTGFPWNLPGHVFAGEAGLSQLSSLAGPYTLTFFCILIFALPALVADERTAGRKGLAALRPVFISLVLLSAASLWGHLRLASAPPENVGNIRLRLVQPNIRQEDKWRPGNAAPIYRTMLRLSGLKTASRPEGLKQVTHLIWPESALPFFMARSAQALRGIDERLPDHVMLITGANRYEDQPTTADRRARRLIYNSTYVLDGKANIIRTYDKKHLVPFGEYLPFQPLLNAIGLHKFVQIRGQFETGRRPRLIKLPGTPPLAPLICYEVIFAEQVVEKGPRPAWLVNLTNDGWYGVSTGPYQHFVQARIRAIEQGLPMIRVANTGISGVIDAYGRVRKSLPLASAGIIDAALPAAIEKTLYARHGRLIFWLLITMSIALIPLLDRLKR